MNPRHPTHLLQTWELLHFLPVGGNMCCLCLCIWILLFVCTETWSLYVTLATLKLTMQNRLALNSQSSSFLSLQSAGIKGRQCPVWLWVWFLRLNTLPSSSHHVAANDRFFFSVLYIWVAIPCVSMSWFPYPLIYQWMLSSLHSLATADDLAWAWECRWHPGPLSDTDSECRLAALVTPADCCGLHGRCDTARSSNPQTHNGFSFLCSC